jgi:ElaB/YqjD/DUF883 family membrane-anchored ribosome-binding protein
MESILDSQAAQDSVRKAAKDAQKIGAEIKSDFDDAVNRSKDAAKDLGENLRGAAEETASSGRDVAQEYLERAKRRLYLERGKRRLSQTAERVTAYADDNTALMAVGAFAVGVLVGHLASRR